jgi:hypothetical protein
MNIFQAPIIRSNSHVIVGQKEIDICENENYINENAVKVIVQKLGYSYEEVRYLIKNSKN